MNRPIKFRGKRLNDSELIYGFGVFEWEDDDIQKAELYTTEGMFEVDPETIGQLFDFGDKDGEELYPGDIVKTIHTKTTFDETDPFGNEQVKEYEKIGVLEYYRGYSFGPRLRWNIGHIMIPNTSTLWRMKAVKIGSIYTHPHLLEVQV